MRQFIILLMAGHFYFLYYPKLFQISQYNVQELTLMLLFRFANALHKHPITILCYARLTVYRVVLRVTAQIRT